ncbi:MAG: gliding motility-associated C-terminal domain-containing protein [Bacteroidetes bacterium]|nr:gliding motility-associated C-terminal domain-containing protein [Bacteroidota bacterium]
MDIVPAISFYIPNTFTPNGDGMNDTFGIAGEGVQDFSMQIFNRWGQLISMNRAMPMTDGMELSRRKGAHGAPIYIRYPRKAQLDNDKTKKAM